MRRLIPVVAALVAAALALSVPARSLAGVPVNPNLHDTVLGTVGGLRYAMDREPFNPGNDGFATTTAGCGGPHRHLLGGGAAAGGNPATAWQAFNRPDDFTDVDTQPDDGFVASGFGPAGKSYRAYAICIKEAQIQYGSLGVPNQPSSNRNGAVECHGVDWHVTSGSVAIATSNSWIASSNPTDGTDGDTLHDNGWRGTAYDTVGGLGGFYIYAICERGLNLRYVQGGPRPVAAGAAITRNVSCGADHAVGGGAKVTGQPDAARLVVSAPYDGSDTDHAPDDGWRTKVYNLSGSTKQVTSYAICLIS